MPERRARRPWWRRGDRPALTNGVRVAILAGALSAAKIVLFAVGYGSFLAVHPAKELAWVYLGLAAIAATSALILAPRLERVRPVAATGWLLLATAVLVVGVALGLVLELPRAPLALLILANLYNISSEIMLWLVAAAWLPAPDLRRATVWICLATALGGFVGGVAAERLLDLGAAAALVVGTLAATFYAALWLAASDRAIGQADADTATPVDGPHTAADDAAGWSVLLAHPLGPPLGAASFMLTFLWVLTEFLCFARYQDELDPGALPSFLARIYAMLQFVEFGCIALFAAPVTRWVVPVWRSVIFPAGALVTLFWMAREKNDLWPVVLAHAYTESASNALFDPVHASNFAAVPLRLQPRLRAVSEGICNPLGMAAGGLVLLLGSPAQHAEAVQAVMLMAMIAAMLFIGVGVFSGVMVAPSLLTALGLTAEVGVPPTPAELRAACRTLLPWARGARLRHRLLLGLGQGERADRIRRRIDRADRRALRQVFALARRCDQGGPTARLEVLLDSRSAERRALVVEAVLSLPLRRLFVPFLPALRRRYLQ